jgi:hypothetical protein
MDEREEWLDLVDEQVLAEEDHPRDEPGGHTGHNRGAHRAGSPAGGRRRIKRRSRPLTQQFAIVDRRVLVALVRAMPDSQSAVLACLVWQASRHQRLTWGPYAGRYLARLSGAQLASMTGRHIRTVRHALSRLTTQGHITRETPRSGRTALYVPTPRATLDAPDPNPAAEDGAQPAG